MGAARTRTRGESGEGGHERGRPAGGGSEHGGRPRPPALAPHPRPSPRHATRLPTHRPRAADDAAPSPDSPVDPDHRGLGARSAARPQPGGGSAQRRAAPRRPAGRRRGTHPRGAAPRATRPRREPPRQGEGRDRRRGRRGGCGPRTRGGGPGGGGARPGQPRSPPGARRQDRRRSGSGPLQPGQTATGTARDREPPPPRTTQATPRPRAARGISPRGTAAATALSASSPLSRSRGRRRPPPRRRPPFSHTSPRPTRATAGRTRRGEAGVGRPAAGTGHGAEEATVSALRGTEGPAAEPTPPHPGTGPRAGEARAPAEQALRGKPPAAPPRGARDPQGSD